MKLSLPGREGDWGEEKGKKRLDIMSVNTHLLELGSHDTDLLLIGFLALLGLVCHSGWDAVGTQNNPVESIGTRG